MLIIKYKKKSGSLNGFTFIEALITLAIFSLISVAFYSVISSGLNNVIEAKRRLAAASLAGEKMEVIRNLDYDAIGTKNADGSGYGVPAGEIVDWEEVSASGGAFYVFTTVSYIDDPYDGQLGETPNDSVSNDYKKVRIKVAWENDIATTKGVTLVSTFPPPGREIAEEGTGTLSINVLNNAGDGIPGATLHITNSETSTDITTQTDNTGNYMLVSAKESEQKYKIEVSKSGYFSVWTFPPYPDSSFEPGDNINASVVADTLNTKALVTDKVSNLTIKTVDPFGNSVGNVNFNLEGGWKQGEIPSSDPDIPPTSQYAFSEDETTDSSGEKSFSDMSFGIYYFNFTPTSSQGFLKVIPASEDYNGFDLSPDANTIVQAIIFDKSINSLLVSVKDSSDGTSPVEGATVRLENGVTGYDVSLTADAYGLVYFPEELPELASGNYTLTVSASGFQEHSQVISITAGYSSQEILLDSE